MQSLSWTDLHAFLSVARTGQLARAAAAEGVDPTTMGRRIRRLENRLGQRLFEQTRSGQLLTEAGEVLLVEVEEMQRAADRIGAGASAGRGLSGLLRISVSEGFGTWFIARHLAQFARRHPHLQIDLVANSGFLNPSKREADLAVMLARPAAGPVISTKLADYRLGLFAAHAYAREVGVPRSIAELATHHRFVGYIPDLLYSPELRYLSEVDPALAPALRSSSINAQHQMVASGAGIGVLPNFLAAHDPDLIAVLPEFSIMRSFWMVTHRDTQGLQRVREFRHWLTDLVAQHGALLG